MNETSLLLNGVFSLFILTRYCHYRVFSFCGQHQMFDEAKNEWVDEPDTSKRDALHATCARDVPPLDAAMFTSLTSEWRGVA